MKKVTDLLKKYWPKLGCYVIYTIAFIPIAIFFAGLFSKAGMNFVRQNDGISQHFNAMLYQERYLRAVLGGLFRGEGLHVPLMNYTLGQGADIILTLGGYDFLNPVSIISVILFHKDMFAAYRFMAFANMFLAGLSLCVYCRSVEKDNNWHIASGALIYAFSGFALNFCTRHPNFMSGMYFMPLMLASAEFLMKKDRKLPLILTVFFSLMTSYYLFYMDFICFAVYLVIRLFPTQKSEIKSSVFSLLKVAIVTAVGGLLSAVWLFPALFGSLFNNGGYQSLVGYRESLLHYPADYYRQLIEYFAYSPGEIDFKNYLGFVPLAMICVWVLFMFRKKEWIRLRVAFVVAFLGMCIPLVGLAFNAFRYASNRWTYAFAFVVAIIYTETADYLPKLTFGRLFIILALTAGVLSLWFFDSSFDRMQYIPFMIFVASFVLICIFGRPYIPRKAVPAGLLVLIIFSVVANITILYSRDYGGYLYTFCNAGEGYGVYMKYSTARVANSANDDAFYRVEMQEERENTEGYNNVNGTTLYFSAIDGSYREYYSDLQLSTSSNYFQILGIGGSTALLDLASVKYFTLPSADKAAYVPYGYEEAGDCVYVNTHHLSPAYLYENYIEYDDFMARNPADRQRAMLQGAVLKERPDKVGLIPVETRVRDIEYSVREEDGPHNPGIMYTEKKEGTITVSFDAQPGCELYLWLDGVTMNDYRDISALHVAGGYETEEGFEEGVMKSVLMSTPNYSYYYPREGICFNLGYSEKGYDCCKILLDPHSNFTYTGLHILANPMDSYDVDIAALRAASCDDIVIGDDRIYGMVSCEKDSLLQLSIPYSVGWKAYVDGKKAHIYKSNIMYMALELAPGSHEIELRYCTPYLTAGIVISLLTLAGMIAFCVIQKKRGMRKVSRYVSRSRGGGAASRL